MIQPTSAQTSSNNEYIHELSYTSVEAALFIFASLLDEGRLLK